MGRGKYIGSKIDLQGKTALLQVKGTYVLAQFDDESTGYGFNWHIFLTNEFEVIDDFANEK